MADFSGITPINRLFRFARIKFNKNSCGSGLLALEVFFLDPLKVHLTAKRLNCSMASQSNLFSLFIYTDLIHVRLPALKYLSSFLIIY